MRPKIIAGFLITIFLICMANMAFSARAQEELKYDDGEADGSVDYGVVLYE